MSGHDYMSMAHTEKCESCRKFYDDAMKMRADLDAAREEAESWQRLALRNYEDGCAFRTEMHEYLEALQRLAAMWRPFMGLPVLDLIRNALSRVNSSNHTEPKK